MWSGLFSSGSKRADAGQNSDECRILFCTGERMSIFDSMVLDSRSQLFRRMPGQKRIQNEIKSAKIELCVICRFSLEKRLQIGQTLDIRKSVQVMKVRSFPRKRDSNFRFSHGNRFVFYGEFDSGSERTLAAWIRHASRAGFLLVAIPREIQRRTGA
jgi:hypothetical protein